MSIVCDEVMEKQLNLWIYQMKTDFKSTADSSVVRLKVKEIHGHDT